MSKQYETLGGAFGFTSTIYLLPDHPTRVCKAFNKDSYRAEALFMAERTAYQRFSASNKPHPIGIIEYYGVHESISRGIILELAENGNLLTYTQRRKRVNRHGIHSTLLLRWALQATEALEFAHGLGVLNSDIHCINMFVDRDLNLKVGDWAGASIDGSKSHSSYRLRHRLFDSDGTDVARRDGITVATEIFALGTALYCIVVGDDPWPELREPKDGAQIKSRLAAKDFPETSNLLVLGEIVRKCWHVEFASMKEIRLAIEAEIGLAAQDEPRRAD